MKPCDTHDTGTCQRISEMVDKPQLLMSYAPPLGFLDIPDPYGGTADDYERAIGMIESATRGLLAKLTSDVRKAI